MKIILSGIGGHMGREVLALAEKGVRNAVISMGIDKMGYDGNIPTASEYAAAPADGDVIVDFSHHSVTAELLDYAVAHSLPLVLATTGQTDEEKALIKQASEKIPLFFASNFSLGVALLIGLAKKTAEVMKGADIEIIETHHVRKVDAPSGTALSIAEGIREVRPELTVNCGRSGFGKREENEIGISSVRMGNIVGIHEVRVCTDNQCITLKHEAFSRALFAEGALAAAEFIIGKPNGLYDMKAMIE